MSLDPAKRNVVFGQNAAAVYHTLAGSLKCGVDTLGSGFSFVGLRLVWLPENHPRRSRVVPSSFKEGNFAAAAAGGHPQNSPPDSGGAWSASDGGGYRQANSAERRFRAPCLSVAIGSQCGSLATCRGCGVLFFQTDISSTPCPERMRACARRNNGLGSLGRLWRRTTFGFSNRWWDDSCSPNRANSFRFADFTVSRNQEQAFCQCRSADDAVRGVLGIGSRASPG